MNKHKLFCLAIFLCFGMICLAQTNTHQKLRENIKHIAENASGKVGVSIRILETGDTLSYQDDSRYPMQSTFKFPIAVALLRAVEKGKIKLDDKIHISSGDLHKKTVSALLQKYPNGNVDVPVSEILTDMVTVSDNNACDILMRLLGGPKALNADMRKMNVKAINFAGNEYQMSQDWSLQYQNWCQPSAHVELLALLYRGKILNAEHSKLLIDLMEHTFVAPKRIRGGLPAGTVLAHRTGTSSTNDKGLSPATNDVGVITLPNGKHLIIAVLLADSYLEADKRDEVIAKIARAAFEEFKE